MTEITDLSPTDASNTSITGESLDGNVANMGRMDNTLQAILGMVARSIRTNIWRVLDNSDDTKELALDLSGLTTATTRTLTVPDKNGTIAVTSDIPIIRPTKGHIYGLTLSNNVTDATNDIDIASGEAASDAATPTLITLASSITKRLDAAWVVGTGNGGLDTGSIANTTYHVWLIQRSDTSVVDVLFSASATAPTMPANYDRKRRIGAILRESASIVPFVQDGEYFRRKAAKLDLDLGSTAVTTAVSTTLSVPTGISVEAVFNYQAYDATNANQVYVYFSDLAVNDEAPTNSGPLTSSISVTTSAAGGAGTQTIRTNTSAQIRRRQSGAGTTTLRIATLGWYDTRGRNA